MMLITDKVLQQQQLQLITFVFESLRLANTEKSKGP